MDSKTKHEIKPLPNSVSVAKLRDLVDSKSLRSKNQAVDAILAKLNFGDIIAGEFKQTDYTKEGTYTSYNKQDN